MNKFLALLLLLGFSISNIVAQKIYKVSATDTSASFSSIEELNSSMNIFKPGDKILFRRGEIFRGGIMVKAHGTANNYITFGAYGRGKLPVISGAIVPENWKQLNKHSKIWKHKIPQADPEGVSVFIKKGDKLSWGHWRPSIKYLAESYDFYWDKNSLTLYVYSKSNPNNECEIRVGINWYCLWGAYDGERDSAECSYIKIENLEFRHAFEGGVRGQTHHWIIQNIKSHHNGLREWPRKIPIDSLTPSLGEGIEFDGSDGLIMHNEIYENGIHGIHVHANGYFIVQRDTIQFNRVYNSYHTNIDIKNDFQPGNYIRDIVIKNNTVFDNHDYECNGIQVTAERENNKLKSDVRNVEIRNNTIIHPRGVAIAVYNWSKNVKIYGNIIYNPLHDAVQITAASNIPSKLYFENIELYNNIAVRSDSEYDVFVIDDKNHQVKANYNVWFNKSGGNIVRWNNREFKNVEVYQSITGQGTNSVFEDPLFLDPDNNNFTLADDSPVRILHAEFWKTISRLLLNIF